MLTLIIDLGSGNLRSAAKALERAAGDAGVSTDIIVTSDPAAVRRADRIVMPGQGAFGDCRRGLDAIPGMLEALTETVIHRGRPFFGICVGMQLMVREGLEHGHHDGLGWLEGACVGLTPSDPGLKIPHMGWNDLILDQPDHPVLAGLTSGDHAYFVHSYHVTGVPAGMVLAHTEYGGPVTAIIGRDTMIGTQFHAEKSQTTGLRMLANFCRWRP